MLAGREVLINVFRKFTNFFSRKIRKIVANG
jgi:hypothetical protein